jgi:catechol 2,3-dioxygenase-like lactoylglutathione lyase family enzyme
MSINPKTPGIHHIGLRCTNMDNTIQFYRDILGFTMVLNTPELVAFTIGPVLIAFKKATASTGTVFTPFNIGLDHVALACETEEELNRVAKELSAAGVDNTGVKLDETLQKLYVAFKDPDRIQWEFYMA